MWRRRCVRILNLLKNVAAALGSVSEDVREMFGEHSMPKTDGLKNRSSWTWDPLPSHWGTWLRPYPPCLKEPLRSLRGGRGMGVDESGGEQGLPWPIKTSEANPQTQQICRTCKQTYWMYSTVVTGTRSDLLKSLKKLESHCHSLSPKLIATAQPCKKWGWSLIWFLDIQILNRKQQALSHRIPGL